MGPSPERHRPRRTCVSCGRTGDPSAFLRIAGRQGGAWEIDPTGRKPGRGIYLCRDEECIGRFVRRLRTRKGGDRWKMGRNAAELAARVTGWWAARTE